MTLDVTLYMPPVRVLLQGNGVDAERIPRSAYKAAVDIWRRDRIARGQWRVEWQSDGEAFLLAYALSHRWDDPDVVDHLNATAVQRKPGDLTDAERDAMGHTKWMEWSARNID